MAETLETLSGFHPSDALDSSRIEARMAQAVQWHEDALVADFGAVGLATIGKMCKTPLTDGVFAGHVRAVTGYAKALEGLEL